MMNVNSLAPEVDPEGAMQIRYKPEETPITLAAKRTYLGQVYLSWAQYPVTETEEISDASASGGPGNDRAAYVVRLRDLRYTYPGKTATPTLGASVTLTRDLKVAGQQFGMRQAPARNSGRP